MARSSKLKKNRKLSLRTLGRAAAGLRHPEISAQSAALKDRRQTVTKHGNVPAGHRHREISVPSAAPNVLKRAGRALAEQSIKESSVQNAVQKNRRVHPCIAVINADGNRKIRIIRLNSVRSAAIILMRRISNRFIDGFQMESCLMAGAAAVLFCRQRFLLCEAFA